MKKLLLTLTLLLSLGFSLQGAAAQTGTPETFDDSEMLMIEDVEGLESAYDRTYSVDFEAMLASPEVDFEEIDYAAMLRGVSIQGMTFDSEESAQAYLDLSSDELDKQMESEEMAEFESFEISELEGFDKDGLMIKADLSEEEMQLATTAIMFIDGNQVFVVTVIDSDVEATTAMANDVVQFIIDAETTTDEVDFQADGTSTGGVFDRLPMAGDEVVGDLPEVTDTDMMAPSN